MTQYFWFNSKTPINTSKLALLSEETRGEALACIRYLNSVYALKRGLKNDVLQYDANVKAEILVTLRKLQQELNDYSDRVSNESTIIIGE